jgi:hypothetical protein
VRLDTLTRLKWKDLKPTNDKQVPYSMIIEAERLKGAGKGKYKGLKQIGFLHSLAAQKLDAYKKELIRKGYMITDDCLFQTALENAGVNSNIIAPLLAHKAKGIDQHYSEHDLNDLLVKFKTALPYLLPQTVEKVKSELDATKAELTETETKLLEATDAIRKINEYLAKSTTEMQNDAQKIKAIRENINENNI